MKLNKLLKIVNGKYINNIRTNKTIERFEFNTKNLHENDIFISINGGYKYIDEKTKYLAIITDKIICINDHPVILVNNIYKSLADIAKYKRKKYKKTKYIGITGSVGKTTTKELLYNILKTKYTVYKNDLNYNNHIGLPYTLINMNQDYDYCILEMGMNHSGEIDYLSSISKPDIGVITNITNQHIENFESYEDIIKAKLEITNNLTGPLFIDKKFNKFSNHNNIINYKDYEIDNIKVNINSTSLDLKTNDKIYKIKYNIPGIHLIENITNCIDISSYLGIKIEDIIKEINNFKMPNNRLNIYVKDYIIIDDSYNSSEESVLGILDTIKYIDIEKIIILGSILELGSHSKTIHQNINHKLKEIKSLNILVGDETKVIDGIHFDNNKDIIEYLKTLNLHDKLILIKGSHAMKLNEITQYLLS